MQILNDSSEQKCQYCLRFTSSEAKFQNKIICSECLVLLNPTTQFKQSLLKIVLTHGLADEVFYFYLISAVSLNNRGKLNDFETKFVISNIANLNKYGIRTFPMTTKQKLVVSNMVLKYTNKTINYWLQEIKEAM